MAKQLRKQFIAVAALAMAVSAGAGVYSASIHADAAAWTGFEITATSVRTADPSGLRFQTVVAGITPELMAQYPDAKCYTTLTLTAADGETYTKDVPATVWTPDGNGWNTVLLGIPATDYVTEVSAQSFIVLNETTTYETEVATSSIAKTSAKSLNLGIATQEQVGKYVAGVVTAIEMDETATLANVGDTQKLLAETTPADYAVVWSSSNEAVATVAADGTVTATGIGKATITAAMGGAAATCEVSVGPAWATENNISMYKALSYTDEAAVTLAGSTHAESAGTATSMSGGNNTHDMPYVAFNGNYGIGDYLVVDFTGDNMPYMNFFAGEVTNSIFWKRGATDAQNKGITITNGFRNYETGETLTPIPYNRPQVIGPHKIYKPFDDSTFDGLSNFRNNVVTSVAASGDMAPYGIDQLSTTHKDTHFRMIAGFSAADGSSYTFCMTLINLDTGKVTNLGRIAGSAATLANFEYNGSIVMYASHGKNLVLDKVYAIEEDTTVEALVSKYAPKPAAPTDPIQAWMTENNVTTYNVVSSTADRAVTLAKSTHAESASAATSMMGGNNTHDMSYLAYNGSYGAGDFVVVDFTGDNMPYFNFFAGEVTNSIFWKRGATAAQNKGITYTNGFRNYETGEKLGGIPSNRPQLIGVSKIFRPFNDTVPDSETTFIGAKNVCTAPVASGDMAPIGIDYMSTTYANTRMRMIIGFSETSNANSSFTFNVVLINLDTGAIICNGGRIVTATQLANFDFSGSIVMYASHGKNLVLDKVYAVEQDTTVDALIAKYQPNV